MILLSIDYAGRVENPYFLSVDRQYCKRGWSALVYRSNASVKIAAFLPKDKEGFKINVVGLQQGLYVAFGATDGSEKLRSLYVVETVTATEISLRPVEECNVPAIYEIDIAGRYSLYLLEAKQAMLEAQINDVRKWLLEYKGNK